MEKQLENQKKDCNVYQRKKGQYCSHIKLFFKFEVIKKNTPKNTLENRPKKSQTIHNKGYKNGKVCAVLQLGKWK